MIVVAMVWTWGGYGLASWGWALQRGYNIPFSAWFSPFHTYEWPAAGPALIPNTQVNPSGSTPQPASPTQAGAVAVA